MLSLTMAWALPEDKTLGTSLWIWGVQRERNPRKQKQGCRRDVTPQGMWHGWGQQAQPPPE